MTGLRIKLALMVAAGLVVGAATAQTSGAPAGQAAGAATAPASSGVPRPNANAPIEINALGSPDGPAAGLLDSANGGMGQDIWSGSERAVIDELLSRVPLASTVYSVRSLARKVVLTVADPPTGQA